MDRFHGNVPYGKIPTKKEPIRTLGFTSRLSCHIIMVNNSQFLPGFSRKPQNVTTNSTTQSLKEKRCNQKAKKAKEEKMMAKNKIAESRRSQFKVAEHRQFSCAIASVYVIQHAHMKLKKNIASIQRSLYLLNVCLFFIIKFSVLVVLVFCYKSMLGKVTMPITQQFSVFTLLPS